MNDKDTITADQALISVDFVVSRKVRDIHEADAKEQGITLTRHVANQLTPLVPHLLHALAGSPDLEAA